MLRSSSKISLMSMFPKAYDSPPLTSPFDRVRSLSIILQDVDVVLSEHELNDQQKKDLKDIVDTCQNVLDELEKTLGKYSELEPRQRGITKRVKGTWKRLTWEPDDIRELRSRITSNVTLFAS